MSLVETTGSSTAVQKQPSFAQELGGKITQFSAALPKHIPQERFARVVMTAVQRNPDLQQADRQSLWNSAMQAAADGLLPDGREGALVIYNTKERRENRDVWIKKVQWLPMVAGIRKKVRNSGLIDDWTAQVVHANDHFEFELGDDPFIKHKPFMAGDRGPVIAAYSVATLKGGEKSREVMTRAELDKVRAASKSPDTGPWKTWFEEMCRKSVAKRHSKVLPMNSDLDDLLRRDEALYDLQGASDKVAANPRLSLTSKLDALANMADPEQDAPMLSRPGATPVAEQLVDQSQGPAAADAADDGKAADGQEQASAADTKSDAPAAAEPEDTPRDFLILDLRDALDGGARVSRLLNDLPPEKRDLLTDEDVKALHARAKKGGQA